MAIPTLLQFPNPITFRALPYMMATEHGCSDLEDCSATEGYSPDDWPGVCDEIARKINTYENGVDKGMLLDIIQRAIRDNFEELDRYQWEGVVNALMGSGPPIIEEDPW